jgi:hypothetical protein
MRSIDGLSVFGARKLTADAPSESVQDLVIGAGKATQTELREDDLTVLVNLERSASPFDDIGRDPVLLLDRGGQTDRPGLVASGSAVLDSKLHRTHTLSRAVDPASRVLHSTRRAEASVHPILGEEMILEHSAWVVAPLFSEESG